MLEERERDVAGGKRLLSSKVVGCGEGLGEDAVRLGGFGELSDLKKLPEGNEDVRCDIELGTARSTLSFLGELVDIDRPRSVGNFDLLLSPLFADAVRSRSRRLSGGKPSSLAGSDCPIESKMPATSSENEMVKGRRGEGRCKKSTVGGEPSSSLLCAAGCRRCIVPWVDVGGGIEGVLGVSCRGGNGLSTCPELVCDTRRPVGVID